MKPRRLDLDDVDLGVLGPVDGRHLLVFRGLDPAQHEEVTKFAFGAIEHIRRDGRYIIARLTEPLPDGWALGADLRLTEQERVLVGDYCVDCLRGDVVTVMRVAVMGATLIPEDEFAWPSARTRSPARGIPVDWRDDGLLWLVNVSVFHPRGFALGLEGDRFVLLGDGTEAWTMDPQSIPVDTLFAAAEALFARARRAEVDARSVTATLTTDAR